MKVRIRLILPALVALAGCSADYQSTATNTAAAPQANVAAPQQVNAASDALGQRLDAMMATRHSVTR